MVSPQRVALVVLCVSISACADPSTPDNPTDPVSPNDRIIAQNGLGGELTLNRDTLDVSVTDVEAVFGGLFLAPQTEDCGLGSSEELGIAIIYDTGSTGVHGFVVEDPAVRTSEGIGVGSATSEILETFGSDLVAVLDDLPSQTGGPIVVVDDLENPGNPPGPASLHYGFDTDGDGVVTRVRAGFWPYVAYPHYCVQEALPGPTSGWPLTRTVP